MKINDIAPDVLGIDENGKEIKRSDYPGKKIALYFYPKDNTSGCTAEACSLRDSYHALMAKGYQVIGVSKDSAKSHINFRAKHDLPFPLVVDEEHHLQELMGVWVEKSMYGKKYMGTERSTFLIDETGKITCILRGREVKTKEHGDQLLKLIEE